jgi:hypothetical protein
VERSACKFSPRHGLHHVASDGTTTDTLICFACEQVRQTKGGERVKWESNGPRGPEWFTTGAITRRPQKLLNDTLRSANVKLADGADKGE